CAPAKPACATRSTPWTPNSPTATPTSPWPPTLQGFLSQLHDKAETSTTDERRRVLRLLVKDVLISADKVTIRHRIPIRERTHTDTPANENTDTEGEHCQLRWGRNRPALRDSGHLAPHHTIAHHPCPQHRAQEFEYGLVADAFLDCLHQLFVRNRRKAVGDIGFHHPAPTPPGLVHEDLQGIVRTAFRAEPERAVQHAGFEDRLEHDPARRLHDPVTNSGNR
ncbi:hypothetical protein ABIA39_002075, partial [Nocardia sp. GAS34]